MLTLHAMSPLYDQPSLSPFVVKAMCLLEMSGFEWRADYDLKNLSKAPQKKLPVLVDGTTIVQDSALIRDHLIAKGATFDAALSAEDKATAHMLTRMLEEHFYFAIVWARWARDDAYATLKTDGFKEMPGPLRLILPTVIRRGLLQTLKRQGMGRKPEAEIAARVREDLDAVAVVLGDKPFLFGDAPTSADATAGAMLGAMAAGPQITSVQRALSEDETLMAYVARMREAAYPKDLIP